MMKGLSKQPILRCAYGGLIAASIMRCTYQTATAYPQSCAPNCFRRLLQHAFVICSGRLWRPGLQPLHSVWRENFLASNLLNPSCSLFALTPAVDSPISVIMCRDPSCPWKIIECLDCLHPDRRTSGCALSIEPRKTVGLSLCHFGSASLRPAGPNSQLEVTDERPRRLKQMLLVKADCRKRK